MDLSEQSSQRLIDLIYAAAEEPRQWRPLYAELQQALGVMSIYMLAIDERHQTVSYSDGANIPVEGELAYIHRYRFQDPRLPVLLQREVGQWTHCHEIVSDEEVARHPFYQEFLLPYDRRYMSGTKLVDTPHGAVVFVTLTSTSQGPLPAPTQQFLGRLFPHLQRAARIGLRHFVYSNQAVAGQMLVNQLRQPVVLMTPSGDVVHTNAAAQELMRSTRLVAVEGGRLVVPEPHLRELLGQCAGLEQAAKAGQSGAGGLAGPGTTQLRRLLVTQGQEPRAGGHESLYTFFSLLAPQQMMGAFGLRPVVVLLFYHPGSAPSIDSDLLHAVFGLTPAECRVATLLADGLSVKEIAERQRTRHDTVRKQLRSIYRKTATNRQAELVRLLLHLPNTAFALDQFPK